MTSPSTRTIRRIASALAGLCLSMPAVAQTPPSWVNARVVGAGTSSLGGSAVDAAGNTYEAGSFSTPTFVLDGVTLTNQGGNGDAYLAKYAANGALLWVRQIGSTGLDTGLDVALDAAGNAYVTGFAGGPLELGNGVSLPGNTSRTYVVRYSPQGTPQWGKESANFGSGSGIGTDASGAVYVAGSFSRTVSFDGATTTTPNNSFGVYLARFSAATGEVQSLTTAYHFEVAGTGTASYQLPKLAKAPAGDLYILNTFSQLPVVGNTRLTSRGATDVLVARFTTQGSLVWVQQLGGPSTDFVNDGAVDAAGNVYATGTFTGAATFGTTTLPGAGDIDGYVVKYAPQGIMEWVLPLAGPGPDGFGSLSVDAAGNPYVAGNYSAGAQFADASLPNAGSRDLLVAALTPQGQLRWKQQAGGPGFDSASHLGLSANGDLHLIGRFANACVVGPFTLNTSAAFETFLARLSSSTLATQAAQPLALAFYPNPATDQLHLPTLAAGTPIQLVDALGRVARTAVVAPATPVSVRGLAPGLYTLRATDAQGRHLAGRVVVE
ncbi:SBBP repeat-containing protein [Hymenobacter puniceus]|uniref:SBBP repeat-containing protein n=1 Tax=Hymenobacter sp. BT190 TaxID=2763505 RepID=UPI0016512410|nr:SBBP repeat-containing protein [Hymenobacter sp. BT190]MBC6699131.1 SBBP repeat-containing protein [Hymenobacter sp. BT190]